MPEERQSIDLQMRREVANALWRLFTFMAPHVAFTYDEKGVTIRVPFNDTVDLGGPKVIYGYTKGIREYYEETPRWGWEEGKGD